VTVDVPNEGLRTGDIDLKDSGTWGVEAAFNLRPGAQLTLLYQRQDTDIEFRTPGIASPSAPWSVEYWHIGGIGGVPRGNMFPFTGLSLGGTRYIDDQSGGDVWKFSIILRLGAKFYVNERLGLMVQARMPWTITNGGLGIGIGTGGAGVTFGGSGIAQIDVGGGIMINI
jgi:hypothetical protein